MNSQSEDRPMRPEDHCFREDNCPRHPDHKGPACCCCGEPADAHTGCDCEDASKGTAKGVGGGEAHV